jgi:hypothetical protein
MKRPARTLLAALAGCALGLAGAVLTPPAASMGRCHHYTTTCEPACMFDPDSRTYKRCAHPSMGRCHHYTTTCTP